VHLRDLIKGTFVEKVEFLCPSWAISRFILFVFKGSLALKYEKARILARNVAK
jgi:hypothetical protein